MTQNVIRHFRLSERVALVIAFFLAIVFLAQGFFGSLSKSLTWDEPSFISAGYSYLTRNDFQLNRSHPPFIQELIALPLLFMNLKVPVEDDSTWKTSPNPVVDFGRLFLFESGNPVRQIALWARVPILLMGTGLIPVIFFWGRQLYGIEPALVGTAVAAFSPNLLAHAKLATEDLGCTVMMFVAVWIFWRSLHNDRIRDWLLCGFITGLAFLSKYTALLLLPIYPTLAVGFWLLHREKIKLASMVKGFVCIGCLAILVVGAGYNFSFDYSLYSQGLRQIYSDLAPEKHRFYYMLGKGAKNPWWYYHLVAFVLKVPVPTLLLIAIAGFYALLDRRHQEATLFLLVPAFVVVGVSFFDKANFGLRRILPAFPFLFLFTAQSIAHEERGLRVLIVSAIICWLAFETLRIYPHHLAYFNLIAGGPERGPYLLADSNIDWGQDLPALAEWQKRHPEARPLKLLYFGSASPTAYNVESVKFNLPRDLIYPKPGFYAISVHRLAVLHGQQNRPQLKKIDWLTKYKPIARAGYSIYIYRFP